MLEILVKCMYRGTLVMVFGDDYKLGLGDVVLGNLRGIAQLIGRAL